MVFQERVVIEPLLLPFSSDGSVYEFSWRMTEGALRRWGRYGSWLDGTSTGDFAAIAEWILRRAAPVDVVRAQAQNACRQGVAVAETSLSVTYKLYLERGGEPGIPLTIEAWRWTKSRPFSRRDYRYYSMLSMMGDDYLRRYVPRWAWHIVDSIEGDERFAHSSGFWLRTGPDGLDQVDFAFPWAPRWAELAFARELENELNLPFAERLLLRDLPVRHLAFNPSSPEANCTVYASSKLASAPESELTLQREVVLAALRPLHTRLKRNEDPCK